VLYNTDRVQAYQNGNLAEWQWKPNVLSARFMPRWASRITLEVKAIRVERTQDISALDVIAEGFPYHPNSMAVKDCPEWARAAFRGLWDSINKHRGYSWDINQFVWVISFERIVP